uniref:Uncharacterized protein n=1 Tax=Haptolina brevifila TaxID=156173 RepID=A0A7S2NLD0_9EUKA|mmetsp:Transcript_81418/g.161942  ORF Transcript_81418/g.161942 Transcript_81418/m.161942 type:complete len:249 (+) Transcript_81418:410-1156(+)
MAERGRMILSVSTATAKEKEECSAEDGAAANATETDTSSSTCIQLNGVALLSCLHQEEECGGGQLCNLFGLQNTLLFLHSSDGEQRCGHVRPVEQTSIELAPAYAHASRPSSAFAPPPPSANTQCLRSVTSTLNATAPFSTTVSTISDEAFPLSSHPEFTIDCLSLILTFLTPTLLTPTLVPCPEPTDSSQSDASQSDTSLLAMRKGKEPPLPLPPTATLLQCKAVCRCWLLAARRILSQPQWQDGWA